jgi:hypothetical protein
MDQASCRNAWLEATRHEKAEKLDNAFPNCACEIHSLCEAGGAGITSDELVARVFTDPASYSTSTDAIVGQSVTCVHSIGLSTIRQGASDEEIMSTIDVLLKQKNEPQNLVGASIVKTEMFRELGNPDRWFGVYATDDGSKEHHADLLGTSPVGSKSQIKNLKSHRRAQLCKVLKQNLLLESEPKVLLEKLRECGI